MMLDVRRNRLWIRARYPRLIHPSDEDLSLPPQEAKTASWGLRLLGTPAYALRYTRDCIL
jgi:hypothetical protein